MPRLGRRLHPVDRPEQELESERMLSTLMLVGLGFLTASLIAILIVPWVWRRAVKVTGKRLQFAAPDSVMEVQADRDQLRAEHALATRKLELRLQDLKDKLARQAVEITEGAALTDDLHGQLAQKDTEISKRDAEIERLRASMSPIETELASRTTTVQQLRENIRNLEDKIAEQEMMIQQTVEAAGLQEAEIEALREASRLREADKVLLPGLDSTRETLAEQVSSLTRRSEELETQLAQITEQQEAVEQRRAEIAGSKTISAQEAKDYQAQISALEVERGRLDADLKDASAHAAKLRENITELDEAWQNRDNPYQELGTRLDAVVANVDRVSKTLHREGIVKSVLAALPGGKSPAKAPELPKGVAIEEAPKPAQPKPAPKPEPAAAAAAAEGPRLPQSEPVPATAPAPATPTAPAQAEEKKPAARLPLPIFKDAGKSEEEAAPAPALEPARKQSRPRQRTRRVRSLAERIRALQEEMN